MATEILTTETVTPEAGTCAAAAAAAAAADNKPVFFTSTESTYVNDDHDVRALVNYHPRRLARVFDEAAWPSPPRLGAWYAASSRWVTFRNARGREAEFGLERNGFRFYTLPGAERDVSTDERVEGEYLPELVGIIKELTGAQHVYPLNYTLRRTTNERYSEAEADPHRRYNPSSTVFPHSDGWVATPERLPLALEGSLQRVRSLGLGLGADGDGADRHAARARRWAMLQTWRPLRTLERDPLALCDAATLAPADWRLRGGFVYPFSVLTHPPGEEEAHRWYYLHGMRPSEMFVFMGFDSRQLDGEPGYTGYAGAHTCFILPDSQDKPPRESIEARFICLWD